MAAGIRIGGLNHRLLRTIALLATLCAAIAYLQFSVGAVGLVANPKEHERSTSARAGIGESVRTSFGVVAVEAVQTISPDSPESLAEAARDNTASASRHDVQVQVFATLTNLRNREVVYGPDQFLLSIDGNETVAPARSSMPSGTLQPQASISGDLDFLVPRDATQLWIQFLENGTTTPIVIDLGNIDVPVAGDPRSPPGR